MSLLLQKKYLLLLEEELQSEEAELIALYYLNKRKHRFWKRSHLYYHTSHGEFFTLFNELDDESFTKSYRLPRNIFYELHNLIKPHIFKQDTNYRRSICTQERLAVCLKYLATGSKFSQIAENFRIGKSTVPRIIEDVCDALWTVLQPLVMPELNENDWKKISKQFEEIWQFKNCVGAIDGKHVYMFAPPKSGSSYYCYKHRFSTVMMCVADATRRIIMVDIGSMGRFSDGGIFADSIFGIRLRENRLNLPQPQPLYQNGEPVPFVFIGDEAFPLMTNLMRPYPRDNLNNEKRTYNYRLSRARRIVEATFGVLSRKWLSSVFNCPFVWSSSMVPHTGVLSLINEHLDPSYTVDLLARKYSLNFWDRVHHLWIINNIKFYRWWQRDEYNEQFKQLFEQATNKRGRQLPHFDDVRYNGSLMLGNSHEAVGDSIALPQNYKHIGGYHIRNTIDPLPKDLQKLMDDSKDGVIYFSMGSMLKSSRIPDRIKRKLLDMFAGLKQTVVWKMEQVIQDLPKNVYVVSWAPQQSILSHPNCVLFITHGGLLSLMEALTYGVPIIGVPFYADQYMNIERAAAKGFGKRIDFSENIPEDLKIAIKEMLENPKYHQSTKKWSGIFKNNIVPPSQALVYWIEYVVQSHGAPHLRSPALHVRWYTKLYLDLVLLLTVALVLIGVVAKSILKMIRNDDSRKQKSS